MLRHVLGRLGSKRETPPRLRTTDQELVARFLEDREEAAFAALMQRHGVMVLGVCERILHNRHDAEDACQAVFLVLARNAASIRRCSSLASWLHGVALRVARKMYTSLARRSAREAVAAAQKPSASEAGDMSWREVQRLLDKELQCLPNRYRAPLVLCYLQGRTHDEAARELGWTLGALRGQLVRGREKLRRRLLRRGVTGASALALVALVPGLGPAAVPPALVAATVQASVPMATGVALSSLVPERVTALVNECLQLALRTRLAIAASLVSCVVLLGLALTLYADPWATPDARPASARVTPVWSQARRLEIPSAPHVWTVAFSPDGKRIAAGTGGVLPTAGELRVWDVASGALQFSLPCARSVRCVIFSPDGQRLATAEHDGAARVRDAATGDVLLTLRGHASLPDAVTYSADGKLLATCSWDGTVKLWDAVTGAEVRTLGRDAAQVFGVAFCGDGLLASGGADGMARIRRAATGQTLSLLAGHESTVHWLAASPDGQTVATASWDKTVRLWDAATGRPAAVLRGHTEPVLAVAFSPEGTLLASASGHWSDGGSPLIPAPAEVILWDLAAHRAQARLRHTDRVFGVAISPDSSLVATACWDGAVTLWAAGQAAPADQDHDAPPQGLQFVMAQAPADEPLPEKNYAEDYHPSLQGEAKEIAGLQLIGPDVAECVTFEQAGLHLTLPLGHPRQRSGTGVVTDFGIKGDFEITLGFEILGDSRPGGGGNPTDLKLVVVPNERPEPEVWFKTTQNRAYLARKLSGLNGRGLYLADQTKWNPVLPKDQWGNELFDKIEQHTDPPPLAPATTPAGRLRLVRRGSALYFSVCDQPDQAFTLLHRDEFGTKDLKNVRILGTTQGANASLDALITELRIRADAFVRGSESVPQPSAPAPAGRGRFFLLLIGVPVLGMALVLFAWLAARRRRAAPLVSQDPTPAIVFACPGCGKRLKVRSARAGSRLKCPQCEKLVDVPDRTEELP
jgi:RNA polymerase sigma factor (sigma-70 family)